MFGMLDGMIEHLFGPEQRALGSRRAAGSRTRCRWPPGTIPRADALLADAEILVGHWGCPTLTAAVLDRAPRLRLFAYGAGTVKWQVTDAVFERGIVVTSAAAANAVPVAEYATVAAILLANKGVFLVRERQRDPDAQVALDLSRVGNCGTRVGIVGASFVGRLVIDALPATDLESRSMTRTSAPRRPTRSASRRSTASTSSARRCGCCRSTHPTSRRPAG